MKNNILLKISIIFISGFLIFSNLYSEEIKIDSSELNIIDGGKILEGKNGFKSYSDTGLEITGNEFKYNKVKNTLVAEGNVLIIDEKKNFNSFF